MTEYERNCRFDYDPSNRQYFVEVLLGKNYPQREHWCHHCNLWVIPIIAPIGGIMNYTIHWQICYKCEKILWESKINHSHFIVGA